jgi:RNA polymerase sigma factor (sigma-70 family)
MNQFSLFLAYKPLLYKYLSLLYSKGLEWEDWKQQGELILLELINRYDESKGEKSLSSYLKKTLYFRLLEEKRKILKLDFIPITQMNYIEEDRKIIDFSSLSKREKEVIILLYFSQYSEREIASEMKISRRSVRTYKERALKKLRRLFV